MSATNKNIIHVPISKKNASVVDFIKNEIRAKKARHEAIIKSMEGSFMDRLNKISKSRNSDKK